MTSTFSCSITVFPQLDAWATKYFFRHSVGRATIQEGRLFEMGRLNISAGAMGRVALRRDQEIMRGSTKPHFLFAMAAVAPVATKLLVGFPSVSKAVTSFFNRRADHVKLTTP